MNTLTHWTAFQDNQQFASGDPWDVAVIVSRVLQQQPSQNIYIFDDQTGRMVDIDLTISSVALMAQLQAQYAVNEIAAPEALRGAGRPKLGVVAREVTLLPRHWEWLATQPSGASATLRKLVEEARKQDQATVAVRHAQEATDRFMTAMLGNAPGYEAAARALYADQKEDFLHCIKQWPTDLRNYVQRLAEPAFRAIKVESEQ